MPFSWGKIWRDPYNKRKFITDDSDFHWVCSGASFAERTLILNCLNFCSSLLKWEFHSFQSGFLSQRELEVDQNVYAAWRWCMIPIYVKAWYSSLMVPYFKSKIYYFLIAFQILSHLYILCFTHFQNIRHRREKIKSSSNDSGSLSLPFFSHWTVWSLFTSYSLGLAALA